MSAAGPNNIFAQSKKSWLSIGGDKDSIGVETKKNELEGSKACQMVS